MLPMLIESVKSTIIKHNLIGQGEGVVVGLSGGADSICLLHVLCHLSKDMGFKIYAAHVNHMLRGNEADEDEKYVLQFCESINVPLRIKKECVAKIAKEKGISFEEAGREIRYEFFEQVCLDTCASKIAVAHNRNDQVETVLMHIIRGTGLEGIKGMEYLRGKIVRPLLNLDRKEIEEYCNVFNLQPRIDSSNLENTYTRNRIRLDLIPYIQNNFNENITNSILRMTSILKKDYFCIEQIAKEKYNMCVTSHSNGTISITIEKILSFQPAIISWIIRYAISNRKGELKGIESKHVDAIEEFMINGRNGAVIELPQKIRVRKNYGEIDFFINSEEEENEYSYLIKIPGSTKAEKCKRVITASVEAVNNSIEYYIKSKTSMLQFFDYNKFHKEVNLRTRLEGDIFKPFKSLGTKKLKKYFIDSKIPRHDRDSISLVAHGRDIVWVMGYNTSDKYKVTEKTTRVLKLEVRNQN